jgi:hypothetical protein
MSPLSPTLSLAHSHSQDPSESFSTTPFRTSLLSSAHLEMLLHAARLLHGTTPPLPALPAPSNSQGERNRATRRGCDGGGACCRAPARESGPQVRFFALVRACLALSGVVCEEVMVSMCVWDNPSLKFRKQLFCFTLVGMECVCGLWWEGCSAVLLCFSVTCVCARSGPCACMRVYICLGRLGLFVSVRLKFSKK